MRGHAMSFTGLIDGSRRILNTCDDFRIWWLTGKKAGGNHILYMTHVPPVRSNNASFKGKKKASKLQPTQSSQRDPIPTPIQQEVEAVIDQATCVTPTQPDVGSPQIPKSKKRRQKMCAHGLKSPTGQVHRSRRRLYSDNGPGGVEGIGLLQGDEECLNVAEEETPDGCDADIDEELVDLDRDHYNKRLLL